MSATDSNAATPLPTSDFTLTDNSTGHAIGLKRVNVTEGLPGVDVSPLRERFKHEAVDPSLGNTSIGHSRITFIDGDKGILRYRGYDIRELAEKSSFLETVMLLRGGELPTPDALAAFKQEMAENANVPPAVPAIIRAFPKEADPMTVLHAATLGLDSNLRDQEAHLVIAKMPTIVAMVIRHSQGKENFIQPDPNLSYAANFLKMTFADDDGNYEVNPIMEQAMDKILILHADHEQNASTTAARNTRSTKASKVTSIANGIGALSGPLHGGANVEVLDMLEKIGNVDNIPDYLDRVERKEAQLMGFGHRVYKNMDPRAGVLKGDIDALLANLSVFDPRLEVAKQLENQALSDQYFIDRKLFPNVDFYSGIGFAAMEFPENTFTTLFTLGRTPGWLAQIEEVDANKERITRPRQSYVGEKERGYIEPTLRGGSNGGPGFGADGAVAALS